MLIKQCKMLNANMEKRFSYFLKKHNFKKYYDPYSPCIFFSLWGLGSLKNHKSFALIIWRGTDVVKMKDKLKAIKKRKNTYHIAISSYIAKDLDEYGIKYKMIPIVGVDMKHFQPEPMGNEIYTYIPHTNNKKYHERYGMQMIKALKKRIKYKINITHPDKYSRTKIVKIYKKCFCSLRFTKHDGLPSQVIEMGLMGRKSFYNGGIPGSIRWDKNINNIIENIEIEAKKIGAIDYNYPKEISNFINIKDKWKNTSFWT